MLLDTETEARLLPKMGYDHVKCFVEMMRCDDHHMSKGDLLQKLNKLQQFGVAPVTESTIISLLQLSGSHAAIALDRADFSLAAVTSIAKYGTNSGYLSLFGLFPAKADKEFQHYFWIMLEGDKNNNGNGNLIAKIIPQPIMEDQSTDLRCIRGKFPHAQVLFELVANDAFYNCDVSTVSIGGNISVDVEKGNEFEKYCRDQLGFTVIDPNTFLKYELPARDLNLKLEEATISQNSAIKVKKFKMEEFQEIEDYDKRILGGSDRKVYLEYLIKTENMQAFVARDAEEGHVTGFTILDSNRVLCLYADAFEQALALLSNVCQKFTNGKPLQMFARERSELAKFLSAIAPPTVFVRRYHTRCILDKLQWNKIFLLNCGSHVV